MSATSQRKQSGSTETDSLRTSQGDKLRMLQSLLKEISDQPGINVQIMHVHDQGSKAAAIVISGCEWDSVGNLVLSVGSLHKSVGNSQESVGNL